MAKRLQTEVQGEDHQDDLEILHSDRDVVIDGRAITVREYGFIESLKHGRAMAGFLDSLFELMRTGTEFTLDEVFLVLGDHADELPHLISPVCGLTPLEIQELSSSDGELLTMAWWGANSSFFMRKLQTRLITETVKLSREAMAKLRSAGQTSTPHSSPQGTTREPSAPTQSES
jgi:hypothetical protein